MQPGTDPSGTQSKRVVGRIGRPHGLRGEVVVQVRTDFPTQRFVVGAQLGGDAGRTMTVEAVRPHSGALLVRFAGVADRAAAAQLSGVVLTADVTVLEQDARVTEIARMLGGDPESDLSRAHARELLDSAAALPAESPTRVKRSRRPGLSS